MTEQGKQICDIGVIGLGVMGRNFARNMADHGFKVAGYDRDTEKTQALVSEKSVSQDLRVVQDIREFFGALSKPRTILLLVPAGDPVDAVIEELLPHLDAGDLIIDSGNSRFTDTNRRIQFLDKKGMRFLGMGMSGGASGARHGPSLMPGGAREGYDRVAGILEASAAHVNGDPCVAYLGNGSAGHYVKMVHNGIEYGLMQLISEAYGLMKLGLGMSPDQLHVVFDRWKGGRLNSYLIEITADIFLQQDDRSDKKLIDVILDSAKQKGTGEWTAWDALDLQVPTFNVDIAVMMRDMSAYKQQREMAARRLKGAGRRYSEDMDQMISKIENALYVATMLTFAQGMALLKTASESYGYELNLETVARIWRGGCIIRAALLEDIRSAYLSAPDLENLLFDDRVGREVLSRESDLRFAVGFGAEMAIPIPGLMMALSYLDAFRSDWLPANLIMAQRDYFGAHTYERVDADGTFHTNWKNA